MKTTNPNLMSYRVLLNEEHSQDFQIAFDCMAEDDDHAQEQAENAYPGCRINSVRPDMSPLEYVLFSKDEVSKSDDNAGFWSDELGWTTLPGATVYYDEDVKESRLPLLSDARWILKEDAEAHYGASNVVKMRLILDVTYNLNGENAVEMASNLRKMCNRAIGEGMLTGEADAEVDESDIRVMILPEPLKEDAIAEFMRQRIESGDLALEDIPNRLASYGLMEPQEFVIEVQERMKSAQAD